MISFALVGAGTIGRVHAANIAGHPSARLKWVVDVDTARGEALAIAHGASFSTSVDEMLADGSVEAVIIASSTDVHETNLMACMRARKAVLCEKPIADSLPKARNCLEAARAAGVVAALGFNRRFDPHHRAVHERIRSGIVGAVEMLHLVSRSAQPADPEHAHRAGGMIREKGTHHFDLAWWMAGSEPVEIYAAGGCLFDRTYAKFGDLDTAVLALRFASGALATFSFSRRTAYGNDEMIEVFGSRGMLESRRQRERGVTLYEGTKVVEDGLHAGWFERFAPTYAAELDNFVAAVEGRAPVEASLADGLRAQAVAEAALASIARRAPVAIENVWTEPQDANTASAGGA